MEKNFECKCRNYYNLDLQSQVEELTRKIIDLNNIIKEKDIKFNERIETYELQIQKLEEEARQSKDKYDKLFDVHRKLQKTNSSLEDRLLTLIDKYERESQQLKDDLAMMNSKLIEAKLTVNDLETEKNRYKRDCNIATSLLQCEPSKFISHSYSTLPLNIKERLSNLLTADEISKLEKSGESSENNQENSIFRIPSYGIQSHAAASFIYNLQTTQKLIENQRPIHRVSSEIIGKVLQKDDNESKEKLFSFICEKCRKETLFCDKYVQTGNLDNKLIENCKVFELNESNKHFNFLVAQHNNQGNIYDL